MTKFLSRYLKPSQISKVYICAAIASIFILTILFSSSTEVKVREYYNDPIKTVISAKNTREIGLSSINRQVIWIDKEQGEISDRLYKIEEADKERQEADKASKTMANEIKRLKNDAKKQVALREEERKDRPAEIAAAVAYALKEMKISATINGKAITDSDPDSSKATPFIKRKASPSDSIFNYGKSQTTQKDKLEIQPFEYEKADGRASKLFSIIEEPYEDIESEQYKLHLPIGSILTGVTVTGIDAPTTSASSDSPMPVLVRIKKEAILPNLHDLDAVRECFVLLAGYGDLASERVYLRGENISCMREDGLVIEAKLPSFAVGEDGKAGLKGTLVSRNSKVLVNAMAAGYMEGLAGAFNVTPVPVISTDPTGSQDYNSVFSADALQGGVAKGAATSFEKLADYYMSLADAMHPVIEVGAGRVVEIIITNGVTL